MQPDPNFLQKLTDAKMPFGKYKGRFITSLPSYYLEWFNRKGFPAGTLGQYLSTMHEIRINGLEHLLEPLIRKRQGSRL